MRAVDASGGGISQAVQATKMAIERQVFAILGAGSEDPEDTRGGQLGDFFLRSPGLYSSKKSAWLTWTLFGPMRTTAEP